MADAFDAMTTNHPYETRQSLKDALDELERLANIQFDTEVVMAFRPVIERDFPRAALLTHLGMAFITLPEPQLP